MAQISFRCPDEQRNAADLTARKAGYSSLQDYLGTIVTYMAQEGTLPVVISFKPIALTPDDAFQQAIIRFREVYLKLDNLLTNGLTIGEMTPLKELRGPIDDIQAAMNFQEQHHHLIEMAPGQLEELPGGHQFSRCREHFQLLAGHLRTAIRMVNMNKRPVSSRDREEMREALDDAARQINELQSMTSGDVSQESGRALFLLDACDVYRFARLATNLGEEWGIRRAWLNRMGIARRQAEEQFSRLGVQSDVGQMAALTTLMAQVCDRVTQALEKENSSLSAVSETLMEELNTSLMSLGSEIAPVQKI
ncbi:hypothetical protein PMPD1_4374 (plasmid) [Paramixta manurensis]|uniref:Uncharacterized protein n=1 Tax=Paramixta manurensis TaxID=2740817 RepID=A0A6M8UQX0_9GAMM|nr:hypothetical protein PMPD1_4374 [Erwiniaceae bacterium PD-1]